VSRGRKLFCARSGATFPDIASSNIAALWQKTEEEANAVLANTGYAFAVGNDTWHSADPVGPEVRTRDSILLTYFVDTGGWRFLRNRGRRIQNLVLNELRNLKHT
jgi:hypothetical protein